MAVQKDYTSKIAGGGGQSLTASLPLKIDDDVISNNGTGLTCTGANAWAEGYNTTANKAYSHAEGYGTTASGTGAHSEGVNSVASGGDSHAEGNSTKAQGTDSHAEGYDTTANGAHSHAEGDGTTASGDNSHAEGWHTRATNPHSHAEGYLTQAIATSAHAEGSGSRATRATAHAEGQDTVASGSASHAEGYNTTASGDNSHAEGKTNEATGNYSHAEGQLCKAIGQASHAGGQACETSGQNSFAHGAYLKTSNQSSCQAAFGMYNNDEKALLVVGDGTDNEHRSDAFKVDSNGETWVKISGVLTKITSLGGGMLSVIIERTSDETDADFKITNGVTRAQLDDAVNEGTPIKATIKRGSNTYVTSLFTLTSTPRYFVVWLHTWQSTPSLRAIAIDGNSNCHWISSNFTTPSDWQPPYTE